ncbi:fumarylacetoacetate hydrolase family protein [Tepidamorphus sp. 3E244]|uniref:fumarylacetoacetate hydrolase family protein n=1 Tax=Tepidamorphus sp. 3E244 TaxID=3385498 RepID=UPI0038FBF7E0
MDFIFEPPQRVTLPVEGTDAVFPVRRVFCVGRNYAAHTREMGHDPDREPPFFFCKPADAVATGPSIPYPPQTSDMHFEIELVAAIGKGGSDIPIADALSHVFGYGVGIDLTRRDLQGEAKKLGRPWDWGKGFDNSAPMSGLKPVSQTGHPETGRVWLSLDGDMRQDGDLSEMIWPLPDIISLISQSMRLEAGDLIMTGTPAGVGAVRPGQTLKGGVEGVGEIEVSIT